MIARAAIQARAHEWGLTEEVVEKDYVLGWLLWAIGSHPALREQWVFKGGTCLKKCFVETYRFSEDLDFTVLDGGPLAPDELVPILIETLDLAEQEAGITLSSRSPTVRLRPDGRSAEGRIYYRGPRSTPGEARVKLDLTYDETIVEAPVRREIAHAYDDTLPGDRAPCAATPSSRSSPRSCARSGSALARATSTTSSTSTVVPICAAVVSWS